MVAIYVLPRIFLCHFSPIPWVNIRLSLISLKVKGETPCAFFHAQNQKGKETHHKWVM
jgi:hypothetical protein